MGALAYDTRDDRGEMLQLLRRLNPRKRLAFLAWCCSRASVGAARPKPSTVMADRVQHAMADDSADEKLTIEVFLDIWNLAIQYRLDLAVALHRLERIVKRTA